MKRQLAAALAALLITGTAAGCGMSGSDSSGKENSGDTGTSADSSGQTDFSQTDADMFTDRDYETDYDESSSVYIELNGSTAEADSDSVQISGSTITITEEATYIISGTLDDGMIIVDAPDTAKLQLVFDGADINSETSAPLYIPEADKVFVTLAEGTENTLSNGGTYTAIDDSNIDSAIFSRQDLTLNGSGNAASESSDSWGQWGGGAPGQPGDRGGAGGDGMRGTDPGSAGEGESEETPDQSTPDQGASGSGESVEALAFTESLTASDSDASADTEDDSSTSMKGIKSDGDMMISGGSFTIDSADDSVHTNSSVTVSGGTFEIASGDAAFYGEDTLTISGGTINITESYEGLEALFVNIQDGDITIVSTDDGLNAAGGTDSSGTTGGRDGMFGGGGGMGGEPGGGMSSSSGGSIEISGGTLDINASGDGIDANGSLAISGGYTVVAGPTQGDTATLDYDTTAEITGGTFIGTGASGMAQTFSDSEQGVIAVSVGEQSAGTGITLTDKSGNEILSYTPELSFAVVILSSTDITTGETYTITVGEASGEFEAS
ncbi:MAG: carbohydrate-binding domain-containing protein [Mediterraneibacter sp.]